ncbi:MAG: hypothetical protein CRN43_11465 [Candidatus Nephrothrix sp. EaCA]|nr:MAG: hypothetical protein CRN43_11465 [Candidatus Nephrothrix sp. EaCA]
MSFSEHIMVDASSLRYRYTGIGQFCYHLLQGLARLENPPVSLQAYVHPRFVQNVPENIKPRPAAFIERHAPNFLQPCFFKDVKIWHATSENGRLTNIRKKAKLILTIHGLHFLDEDTGRIISKRLKKMQALVNRADVIATVSDFTRNLAQEHLHTNKPIHRIYNGLSLSAHSETPAQYPRRRFLFSIGTFFPRKNFVSLLPMLQCLDFDLVIAGSNQNPAGEIFKNTMRRLGLQNRVHLPGEISESEKNWYYKNCEAFVFPSLSEGFGFPVIEAFHFGKPVFLSRCGSLPEIGKDFAFYWPDFEPRQMAEIVTEGLQNPIRQTSSRIAYAHTFSWEEAAKKYMNLYLGA